jgi:predicted enzyme related to lactoylglutathione lyase
MGIRLGSVVVNVADLELMTTFWAEALGHTPSSTDSGDDFRVLRGERVNLSLQLADTPVTARDQMHLDLYTDDQAAEVTRLTALGANVVRHHEEPGDDYVVMQDPEGNEFCVCLVVPAPAPERRALAARQPSWSSRYAGRPAYAPTAMRGSTSTIRSDRGAVHPPVAS